MAANLHCGTIRASEALVAGVDRATAPFEKPHYRDTHGINEVRCQFAQSAERIVASSQSGD
jgi:hypothetical protein